MDAKNTQLAQLAMLNYFEGIGSLKVTGTIEEMNAKLGHQDLLAYLFGNFSDVAENWWAGDVHELIDVTFNGVQTQGVKTNIHIDPYGYITIVYTTLADIYGGQYRVELGCSNYDINLYKEISSVIPLIAGIIAKAQECSKIISKNN